jgi:D-glycero-alpha-D-manno-heptose-7-phosphate kinase
MIITRTPFRISFFGGGTDYPAWYRQHGGAVLATTINKYCYITCRGLPPFFEHRLRVVYSRNEICSTIDEIKHPSAREVLRFLRIQRGVEIHHDGDLPARSGMGSSSAFTVGLLMALHAFEGRMVGSGQLTDESIHIEQDVLGETVGSQDQVCAAHGGFNHILFSSSGEITVRPIIVPPARFEELSSSLMLFYTGIKRTAADVAESYVPSLDSRTEQLQRIRGMVDEAIDIVCGPGPLDRLGSLLHESWLSKRSLSHLVSSRPIDGMYEAARNAGAIGGKITGAGGGGFMLLFVPPERQKRVRDALHTLLHVPFAFDGSGSRVIFYDPEPDYSQADADNRGRPLAGFREMEGLDKPALFLTEEAPEELP